MEQLYDGEATIIVRGGAHPVTIRVMGERNLVEVTAMNPAGTRRYAPGLLRQWWGEYQALTDAADEALIDASEAEAALRFPDGAEARIILRVGGTFEGRSNWPHVR